MTIMPIRTAIFIDFEAIANFCEQHHIQRMWLFGSVLRTDFQSDSDIDVLVEFDPTQVPGWEFYGEWTDTLTAILGHPVDLTTPSSLRNWVKAEIMATAEMIYERLWFKKI